MAIEIKKDLYIIECMTNLHVGSGETDFGLIDNRVQRDVITNFPTINSSSLKGAIKGFCDSKNLNSIFGDEKNKGRYKFFPGNILAIPIRSNTKPYYLVTCNEIIRNFNEMVELFGNSKMIKLEDKKSKDYKKLELEGMEVEVEKIKYENKDLFIINDNKFRELVEDLPVIARNHLENGESKNLWYEEIVPRKSVFYFGIDKGEGKLETKFDKEILFNKNDGNLVHIGGNVTVGYGACKITKLGEKK